MICKQCGTENAEKAIFCMQCGKRLDGKVPCGRCGELNPEEAKFCMYCGNRLNVASAPVQNPPPFQEIEQVIGQETELVSEIGQEMQPVSEIMQHMAQRDKWKKIVLLCGGACAMAAVFFSLLFTFFIGFVASGSAVQQLGIAAEGSIYDYFSSIYSNIEDTLALLNEYSSYYPTALYITAALGTIVASGTLIAVPAFSIAAVILYVRNVTGKSQKNYVGCTVGAYASFLAGACALLALNHASASARSYSESSSASVVLNAATVAGIVLGAIFLLGLAGCRIAVKGKALFNKKTILGLSFSAGAIVLAAVLLAFAPCAPLGMKQSEYYAQMTVYGGFAQLLQVICLNHVEPEMLMYAYGNQQAPIGELIVGVLGQLVQLVLVVLVALYIAHQIRNLTDEDKDPELGLAISTLILAIVHLVLSIVFVNMYCKYMEFEEELKLLFAPAIVGVVVAALMLALSIVHKVLVREKPADSRYY